MLGTITIDEPNAITLTAPRRYSVETDDPGYLPWSRLMAMGLAVDVRFNGKKIECVVTADERGFIKRFVTDGDLIVVDDNGNPLFETKSGHVVCLVYRPE